MARDLQKLIADVHDHRFASTQKHIRAKRGDVTVVDTKRAILVWEPGKVVPHYAVLATELADPSVGVPIEDPDLAAYRLLRFGAFDAWFEEEERIFGHARDPYHRVDARKSSRHVRVELDGVVLADSTRPTIVFETKLPERTYIPREDLRWENLVASTTRSICAYKGDASYLSAKIGDRVVADIAWSYESPLVDAPDIEGLVAFYDERLTVLLDGVPTR